MDRNASTQISGGGGLNWKQSGDMPEGYFSDFTWSKFFLYVVAALYVAGVGIVAILEPFMDLPCDEPQQKIEFPNPAFPSDACLQSRYSALLGFSRGECAFARRLVASVVLGGLIGWERRQADRPAGIRTMSLVSLGSCLFTINSSFAFLNGPMTWDASRVSAAIPSGVGFLGAGLIFKKEEKGDGGESNNVVHGLTTAASLWLSAAVGIACGGDLFMPASFGVAIMLLLLRFGPRQSEGEDEDDEEDPQEAYDRFSEDPRQAGLVSPPKYAGNISSFGDSAGALSVIGSSGHGGEPQNYDSIHQQQSETASLTGSFGGPGQNLSSRQRSRRKSQASFSTAV